LSPQKVLENLAEIVLIFNDEDERGCGRHGTQFPFAQNGVAFTSTWIKTSCIHHISVLLVRLERDHLELAAKAMGGGLSRARRVPVSTSARFVPVFLA
jgi:hypothetical protein